MARHLTRGAAAVIAAGLLAGCGGGGSSEPLSAAQLVDRGDAVCDEEQQRFAEIQAQPPADADDAKEQTGGLADAAGEGLDGLEDLTAPAKLADAYEAYLASLRAARDLIEKGADAASDQDSAAYGKLQAELADGAPKREKLARAVGFKTCSKLGG